MYSECFAILAVTTLICCPADTAEKKECGVNEAKYPCGQRCELRCNAPLPSYCKGLRCEAPFGCRCKNGYARNPESNECVAIDQCPVNECGVGEIKAFCGTLCEGTCKRPREREICRSVRCGTKECCCDLKGGWVRNSAHRCVRLAECVAYE